MNDTNIQWHPGFVAAMHLELIQNKNDLIFLKEYNLNTKPLEIDLLVVCKIASVHISNEIGKFFRGHNIMEYKSPDDALDIDVFYKTVAYACLYKSYGETLDSRKADDITVSLVRDRKPEGLFRYFKNHGYSLSRPYSGIYYLNGNTPFPTQIIVTKELSSETHAWLKALTKTMPNQDIQGVFDKINRLEGKQELELADSVLSVMMQANNYIATNWKGDSTMYMPKTAAVLKEILAPEIALYKENIRKEVMKEVMEEVMEEGMREGIKEGMKEGIHGTIDILREFGHSDNSIKPIIMEKYGLSTEEIKEYF